MLGGISKYGLKKATIICVILLFAGLGITSISDSMLILALVLVLSGLIILINLFKIFKILYSQYNI